MKVCPTCQADFPNGFQYCPFDLVALPAGEEQAPRLRSVAQVTLQAAVPRAIQLRAKKPQELFAAPDQGRDPPSGYSLALPEPASLVTRLAAAIRDCVREFGQGALHAQPAPAREEEAISDLNFSMPEPGGLIMRLGAAIREFIHDFDFGDFGRSAPPAPPASTQEEGAAPGVSFSIPEPACLGARLIAAIRQFVSDFGKATPVAPTPETAEFQFLLEDEPLAACFKQALIGAALDFRRDPRSFMAGMFRGEGSTRQRRRLLQSGVAVAVIVYCFIFTSLLLAGLFSSREPVEATGKEDLTVVARLTDLPAAATKTDSATREIPKGKGGFTGGSKPKVEQAHGGGGGGRNQPTPPSKGVPPPMALAPQIVLPNPELPKIKNPTLPVPMTVYGDPKALPEMKGPIGDPHGVEGPPSSGPGKGAGIGTGEGTGVGAGQGGGVGPGRGGNAGGGDFALGGGRGPGGSGGIEEAGRNGVGRPVILYKEKARYTEEARQHKVQGSVLLSAVFTAEGRIADLRVVRGLPDGLTEKAIEAALKIRFLPATKNGAPVNVRTYLEFSFALY